MKKASEYTAKKATHVRETCLKRCVWQLIKHCIIFLDFVIFVVLLFLIVIVVLSHSEEILVFKPDFVFFLKRASQII